MYRAISNIRWNEKSFSINTFRRSTFFLLSIFSIDNIAIFLKKIFPCISIGFNKIFQKHFLYNNSALVTKTVNWTFLRVLGLMKKISGDDYRFPRLEKRREGKGKITRAPGWEYKWPQVGQQTETMKTKSVRIYPGLHVVSARAPPPLHRSFIFVEAFHCNAKNFERAVKRRILTLRFHRALI